MHSSKEQKEDIWDLHIFNQGELLQCSSKTNRLHHRLMTQQWKLHHLHKLLLVPHRTLSRFSINVMMVKLKTLSSQHHCNLTFRIRWFQCRISKNILQWEVKTEGLQDDIFLVITLRLTSQVSLNSCLKKFQKWSTRNLTKLHLEVL
jgi:hypothetical protein